VTEPEPADTSVPPTQLVGALKKLNKPSSKEQLERKLVEKRTQEALMVLNMFKFDELQNLHCIGERLEEASRVLKLDAQVVCDIRECYEAWLETEELMADIRNECRVHITDFLRRARRTEKNLRIRQTQLESMIALLKEGKTLVRKSRWAA
jgi:hypothetical protein